MTTEPLSTRCCPTCSSFALWCEVEDLLALGGVEQGRAVVLHCSNGHSWKVLDDDLTPLPPSTPPQNTAPSPRRRRDEISHEALRRDAIEASAVSTYGRWPGEVLRLLEHHLALDRDARLRGLEAEVAEWKRRERVREENHWEGQDARDAKTGGRDLDEILEHERALEAQVARMRRLLIDDPIPGTPLDTAELRDLRADLTREARRHFAIDIAETSYATVGRALLRVLRRHLVGGQ